MKIEKNNQQQIKANNDAQHGFFNKMLNKIEYVGNKLPDPIVLFVFIAIIILIKLFRCIAVSTFGCEPGYK